MYLFNTHRYKLWIWISRWDKAMNPQMEVYCTSGCIASYGKKYGCGNYGFVYSRLWKSKSKLGTQLLLDFCKRIDFKSGKSDLDSTAAVDPFPKP